ncbi:MAG: PilX N-terminal domain-containing pilus assembly protein [Gallionella sp.]|nr:PilX N-terminal domain-containing pilus assembly protein [Gallionella sp.]
MTPNQIPEITKSDAFNLVYRQRGSTLIVSLIILIVLMLLGVSAMVTSDTQYKLAGNLQFEKIAMDNAEISVNAAEQWLEQNKTSGPSASSGVAVITTGFDPFALTWNNSDSIALPDVNGNTDETKRYTIRYVSNYASPLAGASMDCSDPTNERNFDCVNTYVVTARGLSLRGATKFIQTYYAVPFQ